MPYVHDIDPIAVTVGGVHVWWYGLSYAAGFISAHLFLRRSRERLNLSLQKVYDLTICLAVGVLIGGRLLVVFVNEWEFYRSHLSLIPAIWLGGLATHGLIVGGALGVMVFCAFNRRPFRPILDALAIAAALILGCGRIGNFIDGQIVGSVTSVAWAVKFPYAVGFRHPVVLYDGLKNLMLVPILLAVRRRGVPPGRVAALFVLLYPSLRIPIDLFREYHAEAAATGQLFNVIMAAAGVLLLVRNWMRDPARAARPAPETVAQDDLRWRRLALAAVVMTPLVIPSDATRDVPSRYAARHPGLVHSAIYPNVEPNLIKPTSPADSAGAGSAPRAASSLSLPR